VIQFDVQEGRALGRARFARSVVQGQLLVLYVVMSALPLGPFLLGVLTSLIASGISGGLILIQRRRRLRRRSGFGGVWLHLIYASDDNGFAGEIQRIDIMNVAETFRRTKTRGKVYRVFDSRLAAGLREVRSYKYRGLISGDVECAYFRCASGTGSNGTWQVTYNAKDEMAGEYQRRRVDPGFSLPLERFPLRRIRATSPRIGKFFSTGSVDVRDINELRDWPSWVKSSVRMIRQMVTDNQGSSRAAKDTVVKPDVPGEATRRAKQ